MTPPIALQLHSLRRELTRDFEATIRRVAAIGYTAVETATLPTGLSPARARALFDAAGLRVCAAHAPLPLGAAAADALELVAALRCDRLVCSSLPPAEYATLGAIDRACDKINQAAAVCAAHGLRLGVHNHWWEFQPVDGVRPYELWLERLHPSVFFELDLYWVKVGGVDPVVALAEFGARAELLHVKDGPADSTQADMTAVGEGTLDYSAILPAATSTQWLIVELDRCATDMMTAIEQSYRYLTATGLGHGRD